MRAKDNYGGLDRFRLIAAIFVIAIHTSPLLSFWEEGDFFLTRILARVGVPFFLMVTGQFLFGNNSETQTRERIGRFLCHNLCLYGIAILLYLPVGIYAGHYQNWSVGGILRLLLFDGTFYHLWYFPACILGVIIVYALERYLGKKGTIAVSVVLYGIGLCGDSYYGLIENVPVLSGLYQWLFQIFSYTRNGLFLAPLFLALGSRIGKGERPKRSLPGLAVSFCLMTIEAFLLRAWEIPRHDSMYLFLPVVMWFLYGMLLEWRGQSSRFLRKWATWIYILHPALIVVVRGIAKATKTTAFFVENSLIHFLAVSVLSAAAALAVLELPMLVAFFRGKQNSKGKQNSRGRQNTREERLQIREKGDIGRAWIELDRTALRRNVSFLTSRLPEGCELMPAVKAEAYGHGAVFIAKELSKLGIHAFCVASVKEGVQLRKHGIKGTILILGYTYPQQFPLLVRWHLTQTVVDYSYAGQLNRFGKKISVQIGIDTGMHRLGERSENIRLISQIFQMKQLNIEGIFTHLCASDKMGQQEQTFTRQQAERFYQVLEMLREQGITCPKAHMISSYGVLHYPELGMDYARVGIALYGVLSTKEDTEKWKDSLFPVLSLKAKVATVKELGTGEAAGYGLQFIAEKTTKLAVLTIGYADGLPRALGKGAGSVLIRGKRAPIVGLVCMDQTLVDVTGITGVRPGDTAVLIGQAGEEQILASDLADQAGTITNEILSRLGARLERMIVE